MVKDNVVIIDAGSRSGQPQQSRGWFNKKVMKQFWTKAEDVLHPDIVEMHRKEWRGAGHDMVTALQAYEAKWQKLRSELPGGRRPAAAPDSATSKMPSFTRRYKHSQLCATGTA